MRLLRLPVILFLIIIYASCKKDSDSADLSPSFYFLDGDTTASTFNKAIVLFSSSDTITFNLITSSTYLVSKNTDVTIAVADTARTSYNSEYSTTYQAMPANAYSFQTTFTAKDSSVYDTVPITFYKHAINTGLSYMLPINIVSASGNAITAGASIIYLHIISSKLAGIYNSTGIKILYSGDAVNNIVNETDSFSLIKSIVPSNSTALSQLDYADLGSNGWQYNLSFMSDTGYAFTVSANEIILNAVDPNSFRILSSTYDSTNNNIYIKSSYKNSTGDERIVQESLKLY